MTDHTLSEQRRIDAMKRAICDHDGHKLGGVEYGGMDPAHYDGISEWQCVRCNRRWGRWTKRELYDGEHEPPLGGGNREDNQSHGKTGTGL